jgi:hypothetical protein
MVFALATKGVVMPGLGPNIHVLLAVAFVDGRVKPGHDGRVRDLIREQQN